MTKFFSKSNLVLKPNYESPVAGDDVSSATTSGVEVENTSKDALQQWLMRWPEDSLKRLKDINTSTDSSRHVILSLTYGLYDPQIRKLNRVITSLLVARLKSQRAGNAGLVAQINNLMENMHLAVDLATGTNSRRDSHSSPCNRPRWQFERRNQGA